MSDETVIPEAPRRGRPPRVEAVAEHRRRRRAGTLNRMAQFKLDCIEPDDLDLANYVYRWVNDESSRLRQLTKQDDYDFVTMGELGDGFDPDSTDSETDGRVRMLVGTQKSGGALYAYLLKKPRQFWEDDNEEMVRQREAMMAGRIYQGETTESDEGRPGGDDKFYVPAGNRVGSASSRRRGPIQHYK